MTRLVCAVMLVTAVRNRFEPGKKGVLRLCRKTLQRKGCRVRNASLKPSEVGAVPIANYRDCIPKKEPSHSERSEESRG